MEKHRFRRRSNKKLMMAKISTDENWRKKIRALLRFFSLFGEERSKEKNNIDLSHTVSDCNSLKPNAAISVSASYFYIFFLIKS